MNLSDRLREIVKPGRQAPQPPPAVARRSVSGLERTLDGEWREENGVRAFVVERSYHCGLKHGRSSLRDLNACLAAGLEATSLLMGGCEVAAPAVFFDLETTGLNGGAGTLAFLVGCGWFEADGRFVTRQYLLTSPSDERAMLTMLAADFRRAGLLVSFNGKSFDAPLLEMRFLYHRMAWDRGDTPHFDVLHPSRRFWRSAGDDTCGLGTLERKVLGASRTGDVPGFEIPARYFAFLRSGDARPLEGVLEHNRIDLLSLAGLAATLCRLVAEGPDAASDGRELLALGRLYAAARRDPIACAAYERAILLARGDASIAIESLRGLAEVRRRASQHDEAAACWQRLLDSATCPSHVATEAARALAIYHEHRVRDLSAARAFALRSLQYESRPTRSAELHHRIGRIERKLNGRRSQSQAEPRLQL